MAIYFFHNNPLFIDLMAESGTMQFMAAEAGSEQTVSASPATLHQTWQWEKQRDPNTGNETVINNLANYTLTFNPNENYQFQADYNSGSGSYTADEAGPIRF